MKKLFNSLLILLSISLTAHAQHEYRLAKSGGQLKLNLTNVIVEGYNGKEIIFQGEKIEPDETDERAKGLVSLSQSGYSDNTGLGISVTDNGADVTVNPLPKKNIGTLRIKVPENIKITIKNYTDRLMFPTVNKTDDHEDIVLKNLKNEIEVSVYDNNIKLENNTGPMNIKTVTGSVEATFAEEIKGPVSIVSALNFVDVSIPKNTKANIELSTGSGKIYAAKEFNIALEKPDTLRTRTYNMRYAPKITVAGKGSSASAKTEIITSSDVAAIVASGSNNTRKKTSDDITVIGAPANAISNIYSSTGNATAFSVDGKPFAYIWGGENVKGKINGGGMNLILKSNSKNIYLRQK